MTFSHLLIQVSSFIYPISVVFKRYYRNKYKFILMFLKTYWLVFEYHLFFQQLEVYNDWNLQPIAIGHDFHVTLVIFLDKEGDFSSVTELKFFENSGDVVFNCAFR